MNPENTTPADSPDSEKAKSRSVALPPYLWKTVDDKVDQDFGGNRSAYFRQLVVQDLMALAEPAAGRGPLLALISKYHPTLATEANLIVTQDRNAGLPPFSQEKLIARLLEAAVQIIHIQQASERSIVREETPIQASMRRDRELQYALESATSIMAGGPLLDKAAEIMRQPSALERRRQAAPGGDKQKQGGA
jgi:hypothetical protein